MKIPFGKPIIGKAEFNSIKKVLNSSRLVHGSKTEEFEKSFSNFVGGGFATSLSSCTSGLHLANIILGIGSNDEVLVPSLSHVATVHAVEYVGAKPIFIDADVKTGNIDLDLLQPKVTSKTKALIIVHYLGLPLNMDKVTKFCKKNKIFLIEDCALALGSRFKKKHVGLFGEIGAFSFYPVKHITTAEGGMVISKNKKIIDKVKKFKAFGYDRPLNQRIIPGMYDVNLLGYNFRMNEIEAAIGLEQLKQLPSFIRKRITNMSIYKSQIKNINNIRLIDNDLNEALNSYYCAVIMLENSLKKKRNQILKILVNKGIGCSIYYPGPIPNYKFYKKKYKTKVSEFKNASLFSNSSISLPLGPHVKKSEINFICQQLQNIVEELS
ncbi:MAG: cell wall biogenesis protein [Rickettsiales bacterium]|nr:cell wall biogenesis protein [Rickettsiales bacterium]|tara:strand:- start:2975 stop:4117 length:1143 start_codon:yes stop_codon:yes gene_type:complete